VKRYTTNDYGQIATDWPHSEFVRFEDIQQLARDLLVDLDAVDDTHNSALNALARIRVRLVAIAEGAG